MKVSWCSSEEERPTLDRNVAGSKPATGVYYSRPLDKPLEKTYPEITMDGISEGTCGNHSHEAHDKAGAAYNLIVVRACSGIPRQS